MTIREILQQTVERLQTGSSESPQPEAEWMISDLLGLSRTELFLRSGEPFPDNLLPRLELILSERRAGRPLQYILGYTEFYGLRFSCDQRALIPRPETEVLLERAISFAREQLPDSAPRFALDVGTGCGIIGITLAHELPEFAVIATDIDKAALDLARDNALQLGVADRIRFCGMSLFEALRTGPRFSLICANPPYVAPEEEKSLPTEVIDHEPHRALIAPEEGLSVIRAVVSKAGDYLIPGGLLALEIGYNQAETVRRLMQSREVYSQITIHSDLAGQLRIATAVRI